MDDLDGDAPIGGGLRRPCECTVGAGRPVNPYHDASVLVGVHIGIVTGRWHEAIGAKVPDWRIDRPPRSRRGSARASRLVSTSVPDDLFCGEVAALDGLSARRRAG